VKNQGSFQNATCIELAAMAERELTAFLGAVTELYGACEAALSADVWLCELQALNSLPASAHDWRNITITALARLASRLTATKVLPIPSSNCSAAGLLL
jgi:hypothetical protein